MRHKILLSLLLRGLACFGMAVGWGEGSVEARKPNIIFILADDLGKEWVSCYGAEDIETPHIDELARTGVAFENMYVMPQCTPTRLSFLTGQYPFRHGWVNHWDVPRWGGGAHYDWDRNPSMARVMKEAGYRTVVAGKWQINDFRVQPHAMNEMGFDAYCMWTGGEGGNPKSDERYWDPYIHTKEGSFIREGAFGEDVFVDFLIEFLSENRDDPIFAYYPMCLPHDPFVATPNDPEAKGMLGRHKAMVRYTDTLVGRLVDAIEKLGIREETIIIWTADNGTNGKIVGRRHGVEVRGGKAETSEAGVCVPFIVNGPGRIAEGKRSRALISIVDMLPTFAAIAEGSLDPIYVYDGESVERALYGHSADSPKQWIMAMGGRNEARLTENGVENAYIFRDRVLRTKRHKLHIDIDRNPTAVYDLKRDPYEKENLIDHDDEEIDAVVSRLMAYVKNMPLRDNDPIYMPLSSQPWDVEVTAESEKWKK